MTNQINYEAEYTKLEKAVDAAYPDLYLTDRCVDAQNVCTIEGDMIPWSTDSYSDFWKGMSEIIHNSVGQRMEENGLSNSDMVAVGIRY